MAAARGGAVEASGLSLAYEERGEGDAVLLLHGPALGRALWRETTAELGDGLRSVALDRRAYGESEAPDPYGGTTVAEQTEDAAGALEGLGASPAVVCGFDLGALVALDLLRRHRRLVRAVVCVEPPVLALSQGGPAAVSELRAAIERGARESADASAGAVDAYLREMAGDRFAEIVGEQRLRAARAAARPFLVDFAAAPTFAFERRELRALEGPVTVVTGARSVPIRREVSRALADLLPEAKLREADAGHLVPLEAPAEVAGAVRELVTA